MRTNVKESYAIQHVQIVDVVGGTILSDRTVLVEDGRIREVVAAEQPPTGQHIDGAGRYLCPGLIDGHVHFFLDACRDPRRHFIESDDTNRMAVARHNARTAISAGITTMRDCGGPAPLMWRLLEEVQSGETPAPHILCSGTPLMRVGGHCHFFGGEVATVDQVRQRIEQQLEKGAGFVKLMASGGGLTPGTNPGEADLPLELMRTAAELAHEHGVHIAAHCHATESIVRAVEAGLDIIEHASFVELDGRSQYDAAIAKSILERDIVVSPTVYAALQSAKRFREAGGSHNPQDVEVVQRLEERLTNTGRFHKLGLKMLGGTDCGVTDTPFDCLVDELIAYTQAGLSNVEALRTATCDGAAYMWLDQVGQIKQGHRADLILLAENPLEDLNALRKPLLVVKAGQCLVSHCETDGRSTISSQPSK